MTYGKWVVKCLHAQVHGTVSCTYRRRDNRSGVTGGHFRISQSRGGCHSRGGGEGSPRTLDGLFKDE